MFFNSNGTPFYPGQCVKTFDWAVAGDSALPAWLADNGTSPVKTFVSPASTRGVLRCATKVSSPTSGDAAGVQSAWNIDFSQFEQVSFVVYSSRVTDAASTTDHSWSIECNDGSGGFYLQNQPADGATVLRLYPSAQEPALAWNIALESNAYTRKTVGVTIRPKTKEFFVTAGDPYEGAGVVFYNKGKWVNPTARAMAHRVVTRTAAQRTLEFSRIKLTLVHS